MFEIFILRIYVCKYTIYIYMYIYDFAMNSYIKYLLFARFLNIILHEINQYHGNSFNKTFNFQI